MICSIMVTFSISVISGNASSFRCIGLPLLFVFIGLVARSKYYGVRGKDGELAL